MSEHERRENAAQRGAFRLLPIKQVHVYREVLSQLELLLRQSRPGDRLPSERELAERLDVSRVSVREALRSLESTGRVVIRRNHGAFVADPDDAPPVDQLLYGVPIDADGLQWLTDVRAGIEVRVVRSLGERAGVDLRPVHALLDRAEAELADEDTEQGSLDLRFEAALAAASGNPFLARVQKWVHQAWLSAWTAFGSTPGDRRTLHEEHRAILAALEDGRVAAAIRLMEEHVDREVTKDIPPTGTTGREGTRK